MHPLIELSTKTTLKKSKKTSKNSKKPKESWPVSLEPKSMLNLCFVRWNVKICLFV